MLQIEIDEGSGFCFGVTTAIKKAEEELEKGRQLYCLGDIVHNSMEVERLAKRGLITINHDQLRELHNATVLLRAHGEPPETYELARKNNIDNRCHLPCGVGVAATHKESIRKERQQCCVRP